MKIVLSENKLVVIFLKSNILIALIYTVMLNGYNQWLNIRRKNLFHRDISNGISDTRLQS